MIAADQQAMDAENTRIARQENAAAAQLFLGVLGVVLESQKKHY